MEREREAGKMRRMGDLREGRHFACPLFRDTRFEVERGPVLL